MSSRPESAAKRVCVGQFAGAQGVRGLVRVKSFTEDPDDLLRYGPVSDEAGARRFALEPVGHAQGGLVVRVPGIADRDAAQALSGIRLYVERAVLPEPEEDAFYHADLIGLAVELADGSRLGTVRAVFDFGAGDVIEVARESAASLMLPFTRAVVPVVDLAGGRVVVELPDEIAGEEAAA